MNKRIIIVGAGPAGLTAALELQRAGCSNITVLEADNQVGGISRTVNYKGNRIDIGGHRFFSKSDWVMSWWAEILPIASGSIDTPLNLRYRGQQRTLEKHGQETIENTDSVMLVRNRLSRIYYNRNFFNYPLKLNFETLRKLGAYKTVTFGISYMLSRARPIAPEKSLEDFLINRFGNRLYLQFFKEYTEKVWGVPCSEISAEWGAQRIKSLSITKALLHAVKGAVGIGKGNAEQTSLIEHFIYPKLGPGQMWEMVAQIFVKNGGKLIYQAVAKNIKIENNKISSVTYVDSTGNSHILECDELISTMPMKDLVKAFKEHWDASTIDIAQNLQYRDFITVGLLYDAKDLPTTLSDNWIYIQEPGVQVGRVQIFNNWSPYLVAKPGHIWLGLEYFCKETDLLWLMPEDQLKKVAQDEMLKIGLVTSPKAIDSVVIKVPKAYPGYFGDAYKQFNDLRYKLDEIKNLFLIGRNGMHRYNNQDHSMLSAKEAASQIISGNVDKSKIWSINIDDEYHEESK